MPSSRQRTRRGSNSSGGQKSPKSTANVSDLLSPEPKRKDDFIPTPTKKRRVDISQSSADEDESSSSPLCSKRLWGETFESNYKFLMEEDIIRTCRLSSEYDLEYRRMLTGDQFGDDVGATSSSKVSLTEFIQQLSELSLWLTKIDARRRSRDSELRVEKYLDQGFAEELLQRSPRKKLLHEYARDLLCRHPDMETEIGERLSRLDAQWEAVERETAGIGPSIDDELLTQIMDDIYEDIEDLEVWYEELVAGLSNSNTWLQTMEHLTAKEVKERLTGLEARQKEIENRSRSITHVLKLIDKLQDIELNSEHSTALAQLHQHTQQLQDHCHRAWLQSLELLYCTEQILTTPRRSAVPPIDSGLYSDPQRDPSVSSDPCNLSEVVVGSWGRDSGFSPTNDRKENTTDATTLPTSESASLDVLPFSEDEYEKIEYDTSRMRGKSQELDDTGSFERLQEKALYAADLCYDDRLQQHSASAHLSDSYSTRPCSESELFSSVCAEWDASVSRSAEVLLSSDQQPPEEVSQVYAVLSVTPKKAYYRMTALDQEMANESSTQMVEESTEERPRPALLDVTLAHLSPIGEEGDFLPPPKGSSSPLTGQKRRYSNSACAVEPVTSTPRPEMSPLSTISWDPEDDEESPATFGKNPFRPGGLLERSASESSVIDTANRSSSWRELVNQLELDVRHSGSTAGLLIPSDGGRRGMCEDDAGSLADESASSGGGEGEAEMEGSQVGASISSSTSLGGGSNCNGAVHQLRGVHSGRVKRTRRRTSMQLAEQAELIVQSQNRSRDSLAPDTELIEKPLHNEDSLDGAWDNYQVPMYPSTCEDDDEAEEKLDLQWDEQLESTMDTSNVSNRIQSPDDDPDTTIEEFIAQSSLLLERGRYSRSLPPSADVSALSNGDGEDINDLEREVALQHEWLAACDDNLSCLEQLKESLADSGVEDDLEPIRHQVEQLFKQWNTFKEETLGRLKLVEGLNRIHEEVDLIKREAQRLADLLDAPTDPLFTDAAQLDKLSSTLEYYETNLPGWQIAVDDMHRNLCCSLEQEQVDYLDVRKCHAENLHLLCQWIYSLHTRTVMKLRETGELRDAYDTLMSQMFDCNEGLKSEEHLLRCTQLAVDVMNHTEREDAVKDLTNIKDRLHKVNAMLASCEQQASQLSPVFTCEHWQHIDSRLTTMGSRLLALSSSCDRLLDSLSSSRTPSRTPVRSSPKIRRRTKMSGVRGETARQAVNTWRGRRLWRYLRSSMPYQLALLVLFGCVYYLLADKELDSRMGNILFSPQLRQALGSPY